MFSFGAKLKKSKTDRRLKSEAEESERKLGVLLTRAVDVASNALMLVDRDFRIVYMNEASKALIAKHREHLPQRVRDMDPEQFIGVSADIFHKVPSRQRKIADDASRLPHRTDVQMGPLTVTLCLSAAYDENGVYSGNVFEWADVTELRDLTANAKGQIDAISRVQAVIEFTLDGHVITANENFLKATGYALDEIKGRHHSIFVEETYRLSPEYRAFWEKLARGKYDAGLYKRIGKAGKEVWLQASYNPILDLSGKPMKVVKYATDVTEPKLKTIDFEGQIAAIDRVDAVIEFSLDGKVLKANENFLKTVGYTLEEVRGQHHSMFVEPSFRQSPDYQTFWDNLRRGLFNAGDFKRIAKGGREVWLHASYNPIFDLNGKPWKVVKYATDVTAQKHAEFQLQMAVQQVQEVIEAARSNDLTRRVPLEGKTGEIEKLCSGVNGLVDAMSGIVGDILASSSTIASAAAEIASGANDLSQRTEQQASSLEETAASMEEMAATVKQNADNAQQANQLAIGARASTTDNAAIAAQVGEAMGHIEQSSHKISEIIGVIDEIAFQTNLLALNAAVEAARAGDAGKGFAVVASEVRSLAQRTSVAAKDIKGLIQESGRQVKDGVKLVDNAGVSLSETVKAINRVADIVAEIAAASKEQATGVEEINKAVVQMDQMTQQNAALVEENAAASRTLQEEAQSMHEKMSVFSIADDGRGGAGVAHAHNVMEIAPPKRAAAAPAAKPRPARAMKAVNGVAQAQAALQAAYPDDQDWKEF